MCHVGTSVLNPALFSSRVNTGWARLFSIYPSHLKCNISFLTRYTNPTFLLQTAKEGEGKCTTRTPIRARVWARTCWWVKFCVQKLYFVSSCFILTNFPADSDHCPAQGVGPSRNKMTSKIEYVTKVRHKSLYLFSISLALVHLVDTCFRIWFSLLPLFITTYQGALKDRAPGAGGPTGCKEAWITALGGGLTAFAFVSVQNCATNEKQALNVTIVSPCMCRSLLCREWWIPSRCLAFASHHSQVCKGGQRFHCTSFLGCLWGAKPEYILTRLTPNFVRWVWWCWHLSSVLF